MAEKVALRHHWSSKLYEGTTKQDTVGIRVSEQHKIQQTTYQIQKKCYGNMLDWCQWNWCDKLSTSKMLDSCCKLSQNCKLE